jgi:hypothetical protein
MNKQVLTLGIVLALGTAGCAGFGVQQGSSLSAQVQQERGLDSLWSSSEEAPPGALEAPLYAEQALGGLWTRSADPAPVVDTISREGRSSGDLWNRASVARSWEVEGASPAGRPSRGLTLSDSSGRRHGGRVTLDQ